MLSILTCGAIDVDAKQEPHAYIKTSRRLEMAPSPSKIKAKMKKKSSLFSSKKVVISSPTGFRHEFHLGVDVKTRSELWDLERWRCEIEQRVQQAAVEHAAMNTESHGAPLEESTFRPPLTRTLSVKRKPVPRLFSDANSSESDSSPAPDVPHLPLPALETIECSRRHSLDDSESSDSHCSSLPASDESDPAPLQSDSTVEALESSYRHSLFETDSSDSHASSLPASDEGDSASIDSSLPPSTPHSGSCRVSMNMEYLDTKILALTPVVEDPNPIGLVVGGVEDLGQKEDIQGLRAAIMTALPPETSERL